ncbi:MAG: DNA-binding protein [Frankiales bacterium]|nr:DNA-binding protein [Frankiales bacterium]
MSEALSFDPSPALIPLPDAAELLSLPITRVHQLIKDGQLVAVPDEQGRRSVPRLAVAGGVVVKGLPGVITLLRDARYGDPEIVEWLLREDESLPGSALQALADNRGTEVKRRAQAAGF